MELRELSWMTGLHRSGGSSIPPQKAKMHPVPLARDVCILSEVLGQAML
jgi:hypothetical protein